MKKISFIIAIAFSGLFYSQSTSNDKKEQRTEDWNIPAPKEKISNSQYSKLIIKDLRANPTDFGFVQKGAFNKIAAIKPIIPINTQFINAFNAMIEPTQNKGEIVLVIRDFNFYELTSSFSEVGKFTFTGFVFGGKEGQYQLLKMIDEKVEVSNMDVTKKMEADAGTTVLEVLKNAINTKPISDKIYTENDLNNFEEIAKESIPLYSTNAYTEGIYKDFKSFSVQTPDYQISEAKSQNSTGSLKFFYIDKANVKTNARTNFAVVYQGKTYINNGEYFTELSKKNNDFYFFGYIPKPVSTGKQIGVGLATAIGTALISGGTMIVSMFPTKEMVRYEFKMDFQNGRLIPLEEAPLEKK